MAVIYGVHLIVGALGPPSSASPGKDHSKVLSQPCSAAIQRLAKRPSIADTKGMMPCKLAGQRLRKRSAGAVTAAHRYCRTAGTQRTATQAP